MQYSPKLKKAMEEIKEIIKKYDIAAFITLHDPEGLLEYLNNIKEHIVHTTNKTINMSQMDYVERICKIGQGRFCCRYLVIGEKGFECMKVHKDRKALIDHDWNKTEHIAQGDNCEGKDPIPDMKP